jgi:hypothetical protein
MQARTLVESEIKDAQARYDKEKSAYENAVRSADNAEIAFSETDSDGVSTMNVHDWLTGLRDKLASDQLKKLFDGLRVSDGTVSFSDSGVMDESAILAYFTRAKGEGLSEFERDLAAWMERNAGVDVGLWSKALSWEEFRKAGGLTPEEYASAYPELPNQGWNQGHDAVARPSYGDLCLAAAKKTLLAEFGGNADDDDVDKAIRGAEGSKGGYKVLRMPTIKSRLRAIMTFLRCSPSVTPRSSIRTPRRIPFSIASRRAIFTPMREKSASSAEPIAPSINLNGITLETMPPRFG